MDKLLENKIRSIIREQLTFNVNNYNDFKSLSDSDLHNIAEWGLLNDFNLSGCWDDANDNLEMAIQCAVEDFKNTLADPYPFGLKNFPTNPVLYRFVVLNNINELNKQKLGLSWFANSEQHEDQYFFDQLMHLKHREGKKLYLISAKIPISKIDIPRTLWQRSASYIENEVVLKNDENIKVVKAEIYN